MSGPIYLLPPELQRLIALQLPLDSLRQISTLCKSLFSPFLLYELNFAQIHLAHQMQFKQFRFQLPSSYPFDHQLMLILCNDRAPKLEGTMLVASWPLAYRISAICSFLNSADLYALSNLMWKISRISHALSLAVAKVMVMAAVEKPEAVPQTLVWVCLLGHSSTLEWFLAESKWETNRCMNGETVKSCLKIAIKQNDVAIMNCLLSSFGNYFDWEIDGSCDLLSFAAKNGHVALFSDLLHHPRLNSGIIHCTILLIAASHNQLDIMKICMPHPGLGPMNVMQRNSCVYYAVEGNQFEMLEYLLQLERPSINPSHERNLALRLASRRGYLEIVGLLLAHPRLDISDSNEICEIFASAVSSGNAQVVALILSDARFDPSFEVFDSVFEAACSSGYTEIVRLFLNDDRVDLSGMDCRPILAAVRNRRVNVVRLIVEDGRLEVAGSGNTPLKEAFYGGDEEMVDILIHSGRVDPSAIGR
ncbi:ankyrin repeat-containing domain protein [Obelidium mucronatum]|nr:ankyrin repeat-containing domain protein [Obelidium mucronatum]